ncbi:MAG: hypothetical protein K0S70_824 [Microbacterium sp.]|jgi:hypothetical protein|nr:hypothetical protein [Microbacterium sp.]
MTDYCATAPWPASCLAGLGAVLTMGDRDRLLSWIENHVDDTDLAWNSLAIALASIGSETGMRFLRQATAIFGSKVTYAPIEDPALPQVEHDLAVIVRLTMNEDFPGIFAVMDAVRERGAQSDLVDALALRATAALQYEAHLTGGR